MKTETILNDQYTSSSFKLKQKLYITEMNIVKERFPQVLYGSCPLICQHERS